jgi:hypothetical protein
LFAASAIREKKQGKNVQKKKNFRLRTYQFFENQVFRIPIQNFMNMGKNSEKYF